jgi:ribulose-phosphate 3-epimerase
LLPWLTAFVVQVSDNSNKSLARLRSLRKQLPAVLPSLLLCDFARLGEEIAKLEQAGVTCLHLDVMDGHFVPNMTYGLTIVEACRKCTDLPLDVHLMISNPEKYVRHYHQAGADIITIHQEAVRDPVPLLQEIRSLGAAAGFAINPPTPVAAIEPVLNECDMVLVMSVMPGFGGQSFDPVALEKLRWLKQWKRQNRSDLLLEVDGGVNDATIGDCSAAGAELFVVGSGIFKHADYSHAAENLRQTALKNITR